MANSNYTEETLEFLGNYHSFKKISPCTFPVGRPAPSPHWEKHTILLDPKCQQAFESIKEVFVSHPILKHADPTKLYIITCDASLVAVGAVLLQDHYGYEHPVAYFSQKFTAMEQTWAIYDKELAAVAWTLTHWWYLLQGARYELMVRMDHQALLYFCKPQKLVHRQAQTYQDLCSFNYKYEFLKGALNVLLNFLSCSPAHFPSEPEEVDLITMIPATQILLIIPSIVSSAVLSPDDLLLAQVLAGQTACPEGMELVEQLAHSSPKHSLYSLEEGLIYFRSHVWVPPHSTQKYSAHTMIPP